MFWDVLSDGIRNNYLDDIYLITLFLSMILMLHGTIAPKQSAGKTVIGWIMIILCLYVANRGLYAAQYSLFYMNEEFFGSHYFLYNLFYGFGIWSYLVQMALLLAGTRLLYRSNFALNFFACALIYMYTSLFADYIMPLLLVAVNPVVGESGYYINFEIGGGRLYPVIGLGIALILYLGYRLLIRKHVKLLLMLPEKQLRKLNIIPALSYIAYSFIYLVLSFVNVYPSLPDKAIYFILIFATIILIFVLMYVALFYGIFSTIKTARVQTELEIASNIQSENLPPLYPEFIDRNRVEINTCWQPAKEVCGDFYDYFMINSEQLAIVIADVSGKGLPASLFMMKTKTLIKECTANCRGADEVFRKVNLQLTESNKTRMFATAFMGILNLSTGEFTYSNAGHTYPLLKNKEEFVPLISKTDIALGGSEKANYHSEKISLDKGAQLFLYTDGISEATNGKGEFYGTDRLLKVLNSPSDCCLSVIDIIRCVKENLTGFIGKSEQADDITMTAIEYKGA